MAHEKLVSEAYEHLYKQQCPYQASVKYSGKFKGYNARINLRGNQMTLRLSKQWRTVSKEIQMGLIQMLFIKLLKKPAKSLYIDMYHIFLQKVHIAVIKNKNDPILALAFDKLNKYFFDDLMEKPNLQWGSESTRRLGYYDFGTDTVTLSTILHPEKARRELMEYVLYHELLHKKFKFNSGMYRTTSHTTEFREWERKFPNADTLEKELNLHAGEQMMKKRVRKIKNEINKSKPVQKIREWWPF